MPLALAVAVRRDPRARGRRRGLGRRSRDGTYASPLATAAAAAALLGLAAAEPTRVPALRGFLFLLALLALAIA